MTALKDAIDELYAAFSRAPKPQRIDGCECCADEGDLRRLLSFHVREIPPDVLSPYASSVLLTVGSVDDYIFFIPRILHVHMLDDSFWPGPEITGRAIAKTSIPKWPVSRRIALTSFFTNVVRHSLHPDRRHQIGSWLCAIAHTGLNTATYLCDIAKSEDAVLAYFNENAEQLPQRKLSNSFWELPNSGHDEIVDWFYSSPIRKIMFDAYGYLSLIHI